MKAQFRSKHINEIKYTAGFYIMNLLAHYKSFNPTFIYSHKQYSTIATTAVITQNTTPKAIDPITNPNIASPI